VTGGRGFIGRAVKQALHRAGHCVLSLDRSELSAKAHGDTGAGEEVAIDITDAEQLRSLFETRTITGIVHLAAILPTAAQRDPVHATEVNVAGSLNLLEMAKAFGVRRFVFGSSLSVYGTCPADQVVTETDRTAPGDLYGAAKIYVELLGDAYPLAHGVEFVSLRIGRAVGAGARSATSAWRSEIFECLGPAGHGEIVIPFAASESILLVHVEDVAKMLVSLVEAPTLAHNVYNAACESVVVGELKGEIERLNPRVRVRLEGQAVVGNPRRADWSRLAGEFGVEVVPILEQLAVSAKPPASRKSE
jgi:nucleoside-diphosphate-sugar epimerase